MSIAILGVSMLPLLSHILLLIRNPSPSGTLTCPQALGRESWIRFFEALLQPKHFGLDL